MQGKLDVAASLDPHGADDVDGGTSQHLILFIRKRYRGSDDDGITGMDTDGVKVFHRADGDAVIFRVPHYLELDLFPAGNAFFDQDLGNGRQTQACFGDLAQLFFVIADTASGTAEGKGRADDDRITDDTGIADRILDGVDDLGRDDRLTDGFHGVLEHLAVFRLIDGRRIRSQKADIMAF